MKALKCPSCGADLDLTIDSEYFFCPFCGSKITMTDQKITIEHIERKIDESRIAEVEYQRYKYERDQKLEEQRQQQIQQANEEAKAKSKRVNITAGVCFLILGIIFLLIYFNSENRYFFQIVFGIVFSIAGIVGIAER